jgi:hypothetical protein
MYFQLQANYLITKEILKPYFSGKFTPYFRVFRRTLFGKGGKRQTNQFFTLPLNYGNMRERTNTER